MNKRHWFGMMALVAVTGFLTPLQASAAAPCAPCAPTMVERTIYVPQYTTQTRKVMVTEYKQEQRTRTYTHWTCVPETKQMTQEYTVMVPHQRTREVTCNVSVPVMNTVNKQYTVQVPVWRNVEKTYTVNVPVYDNVERKYTVQVPVVNEVAKTYTAQVPVWNDVEVSYQVMVPHPETRQGVKHVCVMQPETVTQTYCVDQGQWEERLVPAANACGTRRGLFGRRSCGSCNSGCNTGCDSGCGDCAPQMVARRYWVPNHVQMQREVTVNKPVMQAQPYEYTVTVCQPETRIKTVKQCSYEAKEMTKMVKVCSYEAKELTKVERVCRYEPQTRTCTQRVCDYETKTITKPVSSHASQRAYRATLVPLEASLVS